MRDPQLIEKLEAAALQKDRRGKARKGIYPTWENPDVFVAGWKFNEWDYAKTKISLPTNARGLFTHGDEIVVRGYDKFFNVGEVPTTKWESLESNTRGPYTLSVKENGCIVFFAGMPGNSLIVTSKHSTGPRTGENDTKNHSQIASEWLDKHLKAVGKTRQQLAAYLLERDLTAVGELCDDEFEEHILPYTGNRRGIYLHGLNRNTCEFSTLPMSEVRKAADDFGFLTPTYETVESIDKLRVFLDECSKTGSWLGNEIEGFVIRCQNASNGADFFFKYKFDEPYLMYREWREITKTFLLGQPVKFRKNKDLGQMYLQYITPILEADPDAQKDYLSNKGIISLRQKFLDYYKETGMNIIEQIMEKENNPPAKFVFVSVATIGCGKTTVSVALQHLTGWGHVQNDNIKSGGPKRFAADIKKILDEGNVAVIADRNNHKYAERKQLFDDIGHGCSSSSDFSDIKFICLNFLPSGPTDETWKVTRERVTNRGDNHQSIRDMDENQVKMIMKGFVNRFQIVDRKKSPDNMFDLIIDLDVTKGSRFNLMRILSAVRSKPVFQNSICLPEFTQQQIDEALDFAMNYKPTVTKIVKSKKPALEPFKYFGICVDVSAYDIPGLIERFFNQNKNIDSTVWTKIKEMNEVQQEFHVTIVHSHSTEPGANELRELLTQQARAVETELLKEAKKNRKAQPDSDGFVKVGQVPAPQVIPLDSFADIEIRRLGYNSRILALEVHIIGPIASCNPVAHITIGSLGVPARESLAMLQSPDSSIFEWNIQPALLEKQQLSAYY